MARGAEAKKVITEKLFEVFDGAFLYNNNKEIRVPMVDNGENVEIKITLVCAKDNVGDGDAAVALSENETSSEAPISAPSADELQAVQNIMQKLNL